MAITLLDVGHGNCAVINDGEEITIVDRGGDATLLRYVKDQRFTRLDVIFLSHADGDHIKGVALALKAMPELVVGAVYVNPAQARKTVGWLTLQQELESRRRRHDTYLSGFTVEAHLEGCELGPRSRAEILSPHHVHILGPHDANSQSGVLRLLVDGEPIVLLTADMDKNALERLIDDGRDLVARVLVFPHHGGHANTARLSEFAADLTSRVSPQLTFVSMGRGRWDNPRREVVEGVLGAGTGTHLACSQLGGECSVDRRDGAALSPFAVQPHGAGVRRGDCCFGTALLTIEPGQTEGHTSLHIDPELNVHRDHVQEKFPNRLCGHSVTPS